ncbi:radical SAM additional 4Fe4S-binding domain protein [Marinitoga piezophila KA3]|uniref:Radical SAM additional 4Fe4S-binding domain protein n=1 Tax=Marinitoga piezophila (strain DSM 14283 / JCM 11233 / KA3) TaxID=443254 RepID=H2J492_MARPK|nr:MULTISPECIES: radical SAM protein [Marinitoga]AEX85907.1 radical SAM additional 4Fe4S-binding domain protein [Marinitoga piezophila KA3]APT76339.1 hypothetical protein LN42_08060 [Marinitoga sp. 1137]
MKASRYNTIIEKEDGSLLLFNGITNAILKVEKKNAERIKKILNGKLENEEEISILKKGGFIIENDRDELSDIIAKYKKFQFSNEYFHLTITMTTNCNFNCKYCYQSQAKEISQKPFQINNIKKQTIDSIIMLVKEKIKEKKPKIFSVTFWGGEPLLEKNKILKISKNIKNICEKENIEYDAFIITNGYLLNETTIKELKKAGVGKLIITLDGTEEEHNKLRILKNGNGTFEKIYENIKKASKEIFVKIRINVFPHNVNSIKRLIDKISEDNLKVEIDLRQGEMADNNKLKSFTLKEFAKVESELYNYIIEKIEYYNFNPFVRINQARCDATSVNSLVIDADGKLYKCWGEIGGISKEIGELKENGKVELNHRKNIWLALEPFDEECKNCKVLPYCMGGCILGKVLAEKYGVIEYGRERCLPIKYNLEEMIVLTEKTYRRRKNGIRK